MSATLQLDGRRIDCVDSGSGPVLLFLPGSYSTPQAWRPIQKLLPPRFRMVTTSLCGYGGTEETRSSEDFDMQHEVRLVEALARHIGEPVHLVGHSFGGAVAIAAALAGEVRIASLSLFEANPIDLLRHCGQQALHDATMDVGRGFEAAVDAQEPDAPGRIIDFWGGAGTFAAMPEAVQAYCRTTAPANVLDWQTVFSTPVTQSDCARLGMPVLLVRGGLANAQMIAMTDCLQGCLPDVRAEVVEGAGHFLITSHAQECARLLASFLGEKSA